MKAAEADVAARNRGPLFCSETNIVAPVTAMAKLTEAV